MIKVLFFIVLNIFVAFNFCFAQGDHSIWVDSSNTSFKVKMFWFQSQNSTKMSHRDIKIQNDTLFYDMYWLVTDHGTTLLGWTADTIITFDTSSYYKLCAIQMTAWQDYNLIDTSWWRYNDTLFVWFQDIYPTNNCSPLGVSNIDIGSYSAYPNPCHNDLYIKEQPISITNVQGTSIRILYTNGVLDTRNYPQGIYFIRTKKGVLQILKE